MQCMFEFLPRFSSGQLLLISKALAFYGSSGKGEDYLESKWLSAQLRQYLSSDHVQLISDFKRDSNLDFEPVKEDK